MNIYHATPYDISATGFYFKTYEEYCKKADAHTNTHGQPVEEFEIQFIDGDNYELFNSLHISQSNLSDWFETYENISEEDAAKSIYIVEHLGYDASDIQNHLDDIYLFEGTPQEYVEQYIEDTGLLNEIPDHLRYYFDTEAYTRDMLLGGDITEVEIMNTNYVVMGG